MAGFFARHIQLPQMHLLANEALQPTALTCIRLRPARRPRILGSSMSALGPGAGAEMGPQSGTRYSWGEMNPVRQVVDRLFVSVVRALTYQTTIEGIRVYAAVPKGQRDIAIGGVNTAISLIAKH